MRADDVKVLSRNESVVKFTKLRGYDKSDKEASEAQYESSDSEEELCAIRADSKPISLENMMVMFKQQMITSDNERKEQRDREQNDRKERERRAKEDKAMLVQLLQQQKEASELVFKQQREASEVQSHILASRLKSNPDDLKAREDQAKRDRVRSSAARE